MDMLSHSLEKKSAVPQVWEKPTEFDLSSYADRRELERRLDDSRITAVVDRIDTFADDLFEMNHPELADDASARQDYVAEIASQKEEYGRWFHFSWNRSLVHFPDQAEYQELRTFRNKELITDEEQKRLLGARAAVFGLSVGSNIVDQLVQSGIGGKLMIGDFDTLAPTNLNRIRATAAQVGMQKIDIAAIKTSELDPYIDQVHYREGLNHDVLDHLADQSPDVLFDEVDDLAMKAMLRRFAAERRIPLIMATDVADTSIIDVERYDLDENTKPFNGKLKSGDIDKLVSGAMTKEEREKLMIKIVGPRHISPRLLKSAMQIGESLGGLPQLGATAAEGGSLASVAAREVLLERRLDSGRYVSPMRKTLKLQHVTPLREGLETVMEFARKKKS